MRQRLLKVGSKQLEYEIREIFKFGKIVEKFGLEIFWENIGDPVKKGEKIPI